MNVNFGLFPPLEAPIHDHDPGGRRMKAAERGLARKRALSARALADLDRWLAAPTLASADHPPGRGAGLPVAVN
jgi:methylenetetrahydrofolate--tRNA-(uracil-5-)-methyltransferase